jgi:hypothetical protein
MRLSDKNISVAGRIFSQQSDSKCTKGESHNMNTHTLASESNTRQTTRYRLLWPVLVLTFIGPLHALAQNTCPPVSWWAANGNANDAIGSNHGTLMNGAIATAPGAPIPGGGTAFAFDGLNDLVLVPNSPSLNPGTASFTVQAWIKTSFIGGTANDMIVSKMSGGSDIQYVLAYQASTNGRPFFAVGDGSNTFAAVSPQSIANGAWHLLVGVRDGLKLYLYVDGQLKATASTPTLLNLFSTNNVVIGGRMNPINDPYFKGSIDEVKFYRRALCICETQP